MAAADEAKRDDRGGGERPSVAIPTLLVLLGGVVYGSVITANKIAIEAGFPFVSYTFWQTFLAGALLLAYGVVRARLPALGLAHLRHYVLTSTFGIVLPVLVLTYVAGRVPAGVLTLIFALAPPIAYLLTFALGRERFRWLSVGGVALGFAGVLMIVLPTESLPSASAVVGMIVALVVPISVGGNNLILAYLRPPEASTPALACGLQLAAAAIVFPIMVATEGLSGFWHLPDAALGALAWATASQVVTFLVVLEVARRAGPIHAAQINYVIVAAGFLWAFALFNERLSAWIWCALGAMMAGLALAHAGMEQAQREAAQGTPTRR